MNETKKKSVSVSCFMWIAGIGLITAIPYGLSFLGLDFTDTPYHLNNARHYLQFPSVVLSYAGLALLERISGFGVLGFRVVTLFLYQAVCMLALFLAWKTKRRMFPEDKKITLNSVACSWATTNLIIICHCYHITGYDAISNYLLVIIFCFMIAYQKAGRIGWLLCAGIASALSVLARLPNVCVVFVVLAWIVGRSFCYPKEHFKKLFLSSLVYILAFALMISLSLILLYGSVGEGIEAYKASFSSTNSSYGMISLLKKYFIDGLLSLRWLGVIHLTSSAFHEFEYRKKRVWWYLGVLLIASGGISLLTILTGGNVPTELVFFLNAWLIYWVAQWLYQAYVEHRESPDAVILGLGVLCFAFLPVAGSNTGLIKVFALLYIPWVIMMRFDKFTKADRWSLALLLAILATNACLLRFQAQYEDFPIHKTTSRVQQPLLSGIRTASVRKDFIESVNHQKMACKTDFVFVGRLRHLFNYLYDKDDTYSSQFWGELGNPVYMEEVRRHLLEDNVSVVFLVPDYPEAVKRNTPDTPMDEVLTGIGYRLIPGTDKYRLYKKQ